MDSVFLLTSNANGILKPIAKLLGIIMNGIYVFLDDVCHIQNIALTIIIFTVIIYLCMLPLTYQQQKFSKMSQVMNPEIQKIQKKYKNRKDQASVQAMNEETQAVYKKYGVNPSGSCIFMVIQLLILFPLYRVIYNVPAYVTRVRETFTSVVDGIMGTSGYQDTMATFLETVSNKNSVFRGVKLVTDGTASDTANSIVDILYKCTSSNWDLLGKTFPNLSDVITTTQTSVEHFNNFLGASIVYSPKVLIATSFNEGKYFLILIGILIPVISAASQFLNIRLMPQPSSSGQQEAMASQMKTMNYFMPIYSFFIVFFLPIGVGIYWIAGAVIRCIQQLVINKQLDKMDLAALVAANEKKNLEKMKKKAEKDGVKGETISKAAAINTKNIDQPRKKSISEKAAAANASSVKSVDTSKKKVKAGSMAAKAGMVKDFNENKKS